ncbi:hypothetical protein LCGC14_0459050 [marine sediment metagenome]|uniref:30S ribosomal protein S21 n=1 Tax=marine sediment metagenome TaxID=412755 RepID=A0A0F9V2A4_9ZZZZ
MSVKIPAEIHEIKEFVPLQVEVGSNFEDALRRFKSLVQKSKILSLYKEKQHYEKPSEKKRRKRREAKERRRLTLLRERQMANGEWDRKQKNREDKRRDRYDEEEYHE